MDDSFTLSVKKLDGSLVNGTYMKELALRNVGATYLQMHPHKLMYAVGSEVSGIQISHLM